MCDIIFSCQVFISLCVCTHATHLSAEGPHAKRSAVTCEQLPYGIGWLRTLWLSPTCHVPQAHCTETHWPLVFTLKLIKFFPTL